MFELTILTKDGRELKRYELSGTKPIKVGRALDCDVKIGVPQVSRRHARIEQVDEDEWIFTDLDSTHGSYVNGERIKETEIVTGLEVVIGPAVLRFENMAIRIGREIEKSLGSDSIDEDVDANMGTSIDVDAIPHDAESSQEQSIEALAETADVPTPKRRLLPRLGRKK